MKKMNVCYATSDEFTIHTGISLLSLLDNNKDIVEKVYMLDYGMEDDSKEKILSIFNKFDVPCEFIRAKEKLIEIGKKTGIKNFRESFATYSRAFLDLLIPESVDEILYVDSDTVIVGSVAPITDVDMTGKVICGCANSAFYENGMDNKKRAKELDNLLSKNKLYIQCGILWYSLSNWRKCNGTEKIFDTTKIIEEYPFADQTLINNALSDELFQIMPLKYNLTKHNYCDKYNVITYSGGGFYSKEEIMEAIQSPVIIHYCGAPMLRPWYDICKSRRKNHYLDYKKMSPWKDVPLQTVDVAKSTKEKIGNFLIVWSMKTNCYTLSRVLSKVRRVLF